MVEFHIKELRTLKGITQKELIEKTGIRAATLSDYENNKSTMIRVEHIDKLCGLLDCQVGELITYKSKVEEAAQHIAYREYLKRIHKVKVPEGENNLSKYVLEEIEKELSNKDRKAFEKALLELRNTMAHDYDEFDKRLQALEATHNKK